MKSAQSHDAAAAARARPGAVSLLLAGGMCLLPFLIPYHQQPLVGFYPEWLAAALGLLAFAAVLAQRGFSSVALPGAARWLIGFALYLAVCALARNPAYVQMSHWAVIYVLFAVLMLWLGAQLAAANGLERTATVLAAFILAGAIANALAGIVQFYGRPGWLEEVVAGLHGARAYGNIAAVNSYAAYLALGEAALLYLWAKNRVSTLFSVLVAALLVWSSALSASRTAVLYCVWFAGFAALSVRGHKGGNLRRLAAASGTLALAALGAILAVPWINGALALGPSANGTLERVLDAAGDIRWQAWSLALRIFADAPIAGVGIGEVAGAQFAKGLTPDMAALSDVWISPHNTVLQLLAETGVIGTLFVLGALASWCRQALRLHVAAVHGARWWLIAAVGVELIHSLLEYPLWSAHFLGMTALLMGAATDGELRTLGRRSLRATGVVISAAIALAMGLSLRDYWRLDVTRVTGTGRTLAGAEPSHDRETLSELSHGLLAPVAELWMLTGVALERADLAAKLSLSERVMRYRPTDAVVVRRAIFLVFDGRSDEASRLIERLRQAPAERRRAVVAVLRLAEHEDPEAIGSLLAQMGGRDNLGKYP